MIPCFMHPVPVAHPRDPLTDSAPQHPGDPEEISHPDLRSLYGKTQTILTGAFPAQTHRLHILPRAVAVFTAMFLMVYDTHFILPSNYCNGTAS